MNMDRTVEGIQGMLYITNELIGEDFEDYMSSLMYGEPDDIVYAALDLRGQWVIDSNSPPSLAMGKYVAELQNLKYKHYGTLLYPTGILTDNQKKAIEAIYNVTQRHLFKKEVSHICLYRGFGWSERPKRLKEKLKVREFIQITEQRTLSSWSFSQEIAKGLVNNQNFGFVVKALMPVNRIFAIIDIAMESEAVCISHDASEDFEVVFIKEESLNE